MANIHSKSTLVSIDDTGSSARDLSSDFTEFNIPQVSSIAETTGFAPTSDFRTQVAGLKSATFSGSGNINTASNKSWDVLHDAVGETRTITWNIDGSGAPSIAGEFIVESFEVNASFDDVVKFSVGGTLTGVLTVV